MNRDKAIQTAIAAAVIIASLGAVGLAARGLSETQPTPTIIHKLPVTKTAGPSTSPTPTPFPVAVTATVIPTATMKWSNPIEPPDFVHVFQLVDPAHGYLATGGTTYLITHSYASGSGAPGNAWEKLRVGEVVRYGGHLYQINYTATPAKGTLASQPIWGAQDPDELVMITCISKGPGIPATNNMVIRLHRYEEQ